MIDDTYVCVFKKRARLFRSLLLFSSVVSSLSSDLRKVKCQKIFFDGEYKLSEQCCCQSRRSAEPEHFKTKSTEKRYRTRLESDARSL